MVFVRSLLFWLTLLVLTPPMALVTLIIQLFPVNTRDISHSIAKLWAKVVVFVTGVRCSVYGFDRVPGGPVVFMGNHQSYFDIFVLYLVIDRPFSWLAKKELFDIPFLGWGMKRAGYIPIERGNLRRAVKSIRMAAEFIRGGRSVIIFPEGTRGSGRELLPFKPGGFDIAIRSGVPIVPFVIVGTSDIMPKGSYSVRKGEVSVMFLDPVPTEGLRTKDRDKLMEDVRIKMEAALKEVLHHG